MKTILLQLYPSSNEFVFSFFVKLESEDHDIFIYVLMFIQVPMNLYFLFLLS
jgi:hypothetical protein